MVLLREKVEVFGALKIRPRLDCFDIAFLDSWFCVERGKGKGEMNANGNGNGNGVVIGNGGIGGLESEFIRRHHRHDTGDNQCSSVLSRHIKAPVHLVISLPLSLSVKELSCIGFCVRISL